MNDPNAWGQVAIVFSLLTLAFLAGGLWEWLDDRKKEGRR